MATKTYQRFQVRTFTCSTSKLVDNVRSWCQTALSAVAREYSIALRSQWLWSSRQMNAGVISPYAQYSPAESLTKDGCAREESESQQSKPTTLLDLLYEVRIFLYVHIHRFNQAYCDWLPYPHSPHANRKELPLSSGDLWIKNKTQRYMLFSL